MPATSANVASDRSSDVYFDVFLQLAHLELAEGPGRYRRADAQLRVIAQQVHAHLLGDGIDEQA
jgi:hypothetical protein